MKKKEKEISKFKKWKNKMKETPKGRAYLKLIYWGIFFFVLFVFLILSSLFTRDYEPVENNLNDQSDALETPEEKEDEEEKLPTILELESELLNGTYEYEYQIQVNGNDYFFDGEKFLDHEEGYQTSSLGIIHYYLDDTGVYQISGEERVLLTEFYQGMDANLINLEYIFNTINMLGISEHHLLMEDEENRYTLVLSSDGYHIEKITIESLDGLHSYELSFQNIEVEDE